MTCGAGDGSRIRGLTPLAGGVGGAGSSVTNPRSANVSNIRSRFFSLAARRGASMSRLRRTVRTFDISGEIFSKYANNRHGIGPLL